MKTWHFYEKVYRRWLVLFIGTFEEFCEKMRDVGYNEVDELKLARGMCIDLNNENNTTGQSCTVIWLREWHQADLVHELVHHTTFCLDGVGVPLERNNTEAFAFYMEYWFVEINRVHKRFPNGRSPKEARK